MRALIMAALLGVALSGAAAGEPWWYSCNCDGAKQPCMCPSTSAPGGLEWKEIPQFILFTHDDAIAWNTNKYMREVCDGRYNPNGCPARATMFTMKRVTDCGLMWQMWKDGYEIAGHTKNHLMMGQYMKKEEVEDEIVGMRRWAEEECGVPAKDIRGHRNPYLTTAPSSREVLHEAGFSYDSTLIEGKGYSLSNGMAERVWPYTMHAGIPQNCAFYAPGQICKPQDERYEGLWQVPMWTMSASGKEYTMDYGHDGANLYDILADNFKASYFGNRAPLPIYIHTPWFNDDRMRDLKKFADYTLSLENVYWVTITQLLEWMQNPIPASQLRYNGAMCGMAPPPPPPSPPPPPPPQPLPDQGLYLSLTILGNDEAALTKHNEELVALVAGLLGTKSSKTFVKQVVPLATLPVSTHMGAAGPVGAPAPAPSPADAAQRRLLGAQSGDWGFLQFEAEAVGARSLETGGSFRVAEADDVSAPAAAAAPTPGLAGVSALSSIVAGHVVQGGAADTSSAVALQVVVITSAPKRAPLELYSTAVQEASYAALSPKLAAMGLQLAGEPVAVPFQGGKAVPLPRPPPPPPSPPAPTSGRVHFDSSLASVAEELPPPSSTSSAALPMGVIIGVSAGAGAALAAAGVAVAVVVVRRRRRRAQAPAVEQARSVAGSMGKLGDDDETDSKDLADASLHLAVQVAASAASTPR